MKVKFWGTRGSLASPGPDTVRYGGNTSCVSIENSDGTIIILDAGTGIRDLGLNFPKEIKRIHLLLTHLHMDHLQGLPFFAPLRYPGVEVHIWGPPCPNTDLRSRILRYLSAPLFPISLREISNNLHFYEFPSSMLEINNFQVKTQLVIHPNPTIGYRIKLNDKVVTYLPDHEPALGTRKFPSSKEWTSGYALAEGSDILIHDTQYTRHEYADRIGFGHSSASDAFKFGKLVNTKEFVPFHHDPAHSDEDIDQLLSRAMEEIQPDFKLTPGQEGLELNLTTDPPASGLASQ